MDSTVIEEQNNTSHTRTEKQAAFPRVMELIIDKVRLLLERRLAWLGHLRGKEGEFQKFTVTNTEVSFILGNADNPQNQAAWFAGNPKAKTLTDKILQLENKIRMPAKNRYVQLVTMFGLQPAEENLLQVCLAVACIPSLRRVCSYLDHSGRAYITEELASQLTGMNRGPVMNPDTALSRFHLVLEEKIAPGEANLLKCDPQVVDWLFNKDYIHPRLQGILVEQPVLPPLAIWPLKQTAKQVETMAKADRRRLLVAGPNRSGRRTFSAALCNELGLRLLAFNTSPGKQEEMETLVPLAERQALLSGGAIAFFGDKINDVPWQRFSLPLCIVVCGPEQFAAPVPGFYDHKIDLPEISVAESKKLWEKFVKVFKDWEPKDREIITGHYQVVIGDIVECSEKRVTTLSQAREIINRTAQHELGELAQRIECAFDWPDIVIDETLKKRLAIFTTEARERKQFWEKDNVRKLFPYGRGLIGLCAGPPGTGKTMAAQIMAKNLNLELFRINLSSIISKYVGETSQNLTRILRRAAHLNCVLFFDEADALFTRRTDVKDAHDRYANIDTDTLLQEVENYPGIILMATNKKTLIDNAFIRRIRYYFEFAKPDREQRERIFLTVAAELLTGIDYKRLAPFFKTLAETLELTGSQIKFSLLTALFVASQSTKEVNREHIVEGIEMELLKEGRLVSRNEKQRL